ncbi:MAG: hypothetical protein ACOH17_04345 [Cellulomonas sp.]
MISNNQQLDGRDGLEAGDDERVAVARLASASSIASERTLNAILSAASTRRPEV